MSNSWLVVAAVCLAVPVGQQGPAPRPAWASRDLRAGIIGTDTSHVPAFTAAFEAHPEWRIRVVAAVKGGSPDLPVSATRVDGFARTIREKYGVEIVDTIDALVSKVDVVLLESVDGRPHLSQVMPVMNAGKRVFIDKPLAASLEDARRIVALSNQTGTPFFSTSSTRFHTDIARLRQPGVGRVTKVEATYTLTPLEHHPDLFFYGIHGVEALYAVMGPGCMSVTRRIDGSADVTTGTWKDGRVGVYRGVPSGAPASPLLRIFGEQGTVESAPPQSYDGLIAAIAEFFQTGRPPVSAAETLELVEFMIAAQLSKERGGADVPLAQLR